MLTADLTRAVGHNGSVIWVEPREDMRSAAAERCADHPSVTLHDGVAAARFDEQISLAGEGRFYLSITPFVVCGRKAV